MIERINSLAIVSKSIGLKIGFINITRGVKSLSASASTVEPLKVLFAQIAYQIETVGNIGMVGCIANDVGIG